MCTLPREINDTECIVRLIFAPPHIDRMKLKPAAFRPRRGETAISVVRHDFPETGSDFCKDKGLAIQGQGKVVFVGLAVISAQEIQTTGQTVHDSREVYCGHADLAFPEELFSSGSDCEPLPAEANEALRTRLRALLAHARFYQDPNPTSMGWQGDTISCPQDPAPPLSNG